MKKQILFIIVVVLCFKLSSCDGSDPSDFYNRNVEQLTAYIYKEYTFDNVKLESGKVIKPVKEIKVYNFYDDKQGNLELYAPVSSDQFFDIKENIDFDWDLTGKNYQNLTVDYRDNEFKDISFSQEAMSFSDGENTKQLYKELIPGTPLTANSITYSVENMVIFNDNHYFVDYLYLSPALLTIKTPSGIMRKHSPIYPLRGDYRTLDDTEAFYIYMVADDNAPIYSYSFTSSKKAFDTADGKYYFYIGMYNPKTKKLEIIENNIEYKVKS